MVSESWMRSSFFKFRCSVCHKNRGNQIRPTTIFSTIFFLKIIPNITEIHADQKTWKTNYTCAVTNDHISLLSNTMHLSKTLEANTRIHMNKQLKIEKKGLNLGGKKWKNMKDKLHMCSNHRTYQWQLHLLHCSNNTMANHQFQIEDSYREWESVQNVINRHVPIVHNLHYRQIFLYHHRQNMTLTIEGFMTSLKVLR